MSQQNLSGLNYSLDTSAELHAPHAVDDTPPIKNKHNSNPRGYVHPLLEASQSFLTDKN